MKDIDVLFCGDFAPCKGYESFILENGSSVFGDAIKVINDSDLSFINLECPLTMSSEKLIKSGPSLKASPLIAKQLERFDVIGLANNHSLDYGKSGLADTIKSLELNDIDYVGAGLTNEDVNRIYYKKIGKTTIAIIAIAEREFNYSSNGFGCCIVDPIKNLKLIKEAKKESDILLVTIHGGNEYYSYPRQGLKDLCEFYIDLGADGVVCHHPHVPGGINYYNNKPIVYSLGNFIFDHDAPPNNWDLGYMVKLKFSSETNNFKALEVIPYKQSLSNGGVTLLKGTHKKDFIGYLDEISSNINSLHYNELWSAFLKEKRNMYLLNCFFPMNFKGLYFFIKKFNLLRFSLTEKSITKKLNLLRCESHREALISILENELEKLKK